MILVTLKYYSLDSILVGVCAGLTRLVDTEGNNVWVEHGKVEWSDVKVQIGDGNEHSTIDNAISLVHLASWLVSVASVVASEREIRECGIQLRVPRHKGWRASNRVNGRYI